MLFDDLAGYVANVLVADASVIGALRRRKAVVGESERASVLIEEIFLLEAEPRSRIVQNGRTGVGGVRRDAVGQHDFTHDEILDLRFAPEVWNWSIAIKPNVLELVFRHMFLSPVVGMGTLRRFGSAWLGGACSPKGAAALCSTHAKPSQRQKARFSAPTAKTLLAKGYCPVRGTRNGGRLRARRLRRAVISQLSRGQ